MDGLEPAFALSLAGGRATVVCRGQHLGPIRLLRLEMDVPDVRFPLDLSGGPQQFRRRWCALRVADLEVTEKDLRALARPGKAAPLGVESVDVVLREGQALLFGVACAGTRRVDYTARIVLEGGGSRSVLLSLCDVRLYGPIDMAPLMLAIALLGAAGGRGVDGDAPLGAGEIETRPLDGLLERCMPDLGWRVPDRRGARLAGLDLRGGRVALSFGPGPAGERICAGRDAEEALRAREARNRYAAADQSLARGDLDGALATVRADLLRHPNDTELVERAVGLLGCAPQTRAEAEELARSALARDPRAVSLLVALGALAEERGVHDEAAAHYDEAAAELDRSGAPEEQIAVRLAAARAHERNRPAEAASRLEDVLRLRTDHETALQALDGLYGRLGLHGDRARILHRRAALALVAGRAAELRVALGRLYVEFLDDIEMGRLEIERALALDPESPAALGALAEVCARRGETERAVELLDRLARVTLASDRPAAALEGLLRAAELLEAGTPEDAMARLRQAAEIDPTRGDVRVRLARLAAARGHLADAIENYEAGLPGLDEIARAATLAEMAQLRASAGDLRAAHAPLWRALGVAQPPPMEQALLDLALRVAEARGDHAEAADVLARIAERAEEPGRRSTALLRRGELLAELPGRAAEAATLLTRAAESGAEGAIAALERLAARQEAAGGLDEARTTLETLTTLHDRDAADRARLRLAARVGNAPDAARALLEVAARGATERPALHALRELLARVEDAPAEEAVLLRLLRLEPDSADLMHRRADLLVTVGRLDDASRQIESLLRHCPDTERAGWLMRLGALAEGTGQARQAFARYREALAAGLDGPAAADAYENLRRLAVDRQDWELAARLTRAQSEDATVGLPEAARVALLIEAARLWKDRADRPQEAEACLRRALDSIPDHDETLRALEDLLRERGDRARVAEILERRAQAATGEPDRELALFLDLAALRVALGQSDAAGYAFLRCLSILPTCKPALLGLGKLALDRADGREARTHLRALAGQGDRDAMVLEARRLLARLAAGDGNEREEIDALRALLEVEDDPAERFRVASRVGELLAGAGERDDAMSAYRRALEASPDEPKTLWATARLMREAGRFHEHAAALERLLALPPAPGVPDASALSALLREQYGSVPEAALSDPAAAAGLAEAGNLAELASLYAVESARRGRGPAAAVLSMQAARLYEGPLGLQEAAAEAWLQAAQADPRGATAPALRAAELLFIAEPTRAAEALALAIAAAPPDEAAAIRVRRADALLLAGRSEDAAAELRGAVAADPGMYLARAQLGEVLLGMGDRQGAVAHLAAAAEGLDEDVRAARCAMLAAQALAAMGREAEAVTLWETAATRAARDPAPLVALLGNAEAAGDAARSADLARRAVDLVDDARDRAALEVRLARALLSLGRDDDAYVAAARALQLDPAHEEAKRLVRVQAEAREDWPQLVALLRNEVESDGDAAVRAGAACALGEILERSGAIDEAVAAFERAAALDAGFRGAHEGLLRIHRAAARFSEAARAAEHLVGLAASPEEEGRLAFEAGALRIRAGEPDGARLLLAYACERPGVSGDKALLALARLANDPAKRRQIRDLARVRLHEHPAPEEQATLLQKLTDHFAKTAGREEAEALARELRASGDATLEEISVEAIEDANDATAPLDEITINAMEATDVEDDFARGARNEAEGQTLAARAAYARVLQKDPDHLAALDALADLAFRDGDLALAAALYDRLAGRGGRIGAAELEFRRGVIAESRGDADAVEHFQNAVRHDPSHAGATEALARLDLGGGDATAALEKLRGLLAALDVDDVAGAADLRVRIAELEIADGDEASARANLVDVLRSDPYRESALAPLVDLYENAGDWWDAAAGLERLAGLSSDTATRVERLSRLAEMCFARLGDARRAIETLLRAADLAENPAPLLLRLADLHWETGDLEGVVEMAGEIERMVEDPGPQLAARLAIALAVRGRGGDARRHLAGSLVEAVAEALCDAAERGIDLAAALADVVPTAADRQSLAEALRTRSGLGAERVRALLGA